MTGLRHHIIATVFLIQLSVFSGVSAEAPVTVSLSHEMLNGLAREAQCLERVQSALPSLKILDEPWKRIMQSLRTARADLTPCVFKTPQREEFIDFYGPIAALPIVLISRQDAPLTLEEIPAYSGAFLRGTSLIKRYTNPYMRIMETSHIASILDLVRNGRVDYSLMPQNFVAQRDTSRLSVDIVDAVPLYIGVSKKSLLNDYILKRLEQTVDVLGQ